MLCQGVHSRIQQGPDQLLSPQEGSKREEGRNPLLGACSPDRALMGLCPQHLAWTLLSALAAVFIPLLLNASIQMCLSFLICQRAVAVVLHP